MKLQKVNNAKISVFGLYGVNNSKSKPASKTGNYDMISNSLNNNPNAVLNRQNISFCAKNKNKIQASLIDFANIKKLIKQNKPDIPYDKILSNLGFEVEKDEDGMLILDKYEQPRVLNFKNLGIDEDDMFKHIKEIKGNADFIESKIKSLGNLESIGGDADFECSLVESLGNLKSIGGNAYLWNSKIKSLGNLESIGGDAFFHGSRIKFLGNLKSISGDADFSDNDITTLENLETIGGDADFENSKVKSLGNLETIGGDAFIKNSKLKPYDFRNINIEGIYL